jgi:hypothetical protein
MNTKDMDRAMFQESTQLYWELFNNYPSTTLDQDDIRLKAVQINIFALCVMHMAESGWPRHVLDQQFEDCWDSGINQGYTKLINKKLTIKDQE